MNLRASNVVALATLFVGGAVAQTKTPEPNPAGSLAHLRHGEELLKQRNLQEAAIEFYAVARGDHDPAWTVVWSHIELGRTFDATGQRDRAIQEYQRALDTNDDSFDALAVANTYLTKAPSRDEVSPLPSDVAKFTSPQILSRVEPEYSAEALLARLEGSVLLSVSLARDGSIADLHVLTSLGLGLDEAALNAVRHWTFAPGTIGGQPAPLAVMIPVQFHLPSRVPGWHVTKIQFANPDGAARPVVQRAGGWFAPAKMSPELAEEATIDAAMSRQPTATVSIEIDPLGNPEKLHVDTASLPIWGEDAVRMLNEWRFSPAIQRETPVATHCVMDLAWYVQ